MSNTMSDPEPNVTPRRVVFFGDSRAAWWDVPVLPGLRCVAVGVPGGAAADLARQFRTLVQPLRPDSVVIQMGVNDLAGLIAHAPDTPQRIAATVAAIGAVVRQARALGAAVILTTIFPLARGLYRDDAVQAAIAEVNTALLGSADDQIIVFDSAAVLAEPDGYVRPAFAADELHLSAAGYAVLNAALAPLLASSVAATRLTRATATSAANGRP
jgi:lysophospholipase L1-like esterase